MGWNHQLEILYAESCPFDPFVFYQAIGQALQHDSLQRSAEVGTMARSVKSELLGFPVGGLEV